MSAQPNAAMKFVRRIFPKVPDFFALLQAQSSLAVTSMNQLVEFMSTGHAEYADEVKAFERKASVLKEQSMTALNTAFSTPMDREDLYRAISTLHRITTYARTTVREMEQLHVAQLHRVNFDKPQDDLQSATTHYQALAVINASKYQR